MTTAVSPTTTTHSKFSFAFRSSWRLAIAAAIVSTGVAITCRKTPGSDAHAFAESLARESGAIVSEKDLRWEPSDGSVNDAILGRNVLFLARVGNPDAPRDVYRARVRVSPEGHPIEIESVHNLTATELGDDAELVVSGSRAAFTTYAFGRAQSVTMFDLAGEGEQNLTEKFPDRVMSYLTNVQEKGTGAGIARFDVTLDKPVKYVGLSLKSDALYLTTADDTPATLRTARLDSHGDLQTNAIGLHAQPARHLPKRFIFWAVDTARAVPWIGAAPIAWLEEKTFGVRSTFKDLALHATANKEDFELAAPVTEAARVLDTSEAESDTEHWPPPPMRSIWKNKEAGEGEWVMPKMPWLKKMSNDAPSAFFQTFVRPDEEHPDAKILLVAMDMRQLDLDMEAGSEDPKPLTGAPGSGRIPRDPKIYTKVAAAMNGGFKTEHGFYGMMVKKRVLLPPQKGAASLVVLNDGRIGLGSWGNTTEVGGIQDVSDGDIQSFRQNLDPLVDNDQINPTKRWQWGFTLPGTSMQTERTGICVNAAGHLIYAWGEEVSGPTLAKALKMAGCVYAMHLDMNPHHTGFIYANITELKGHGYKSELLTDKMGIQPERYIEYAPKDFFYMMIHDPVPHIADLAWQKDDGLQPAPSFIPAIFHAPDMTGANEGATGVTLTTIDPARAGFRIRAGKAEPDNKTGQRGASELGSDDAHRVLFAIGVGTAREKFPQGLVVDGKTALAMTGSDSHAALVARANGELAITTTTSNEVSEKGADAVEVPLLFSGENHFPAMGARAALGLAKDGRMFLATVSSASESDKLESALKHVGCTQAVVLSRGGQADGNAPLFARAGTLSSPKSFYDETVLYGLSVPMKARGFRFDPVNPVPAPPVKK